MDFNEVMDRVAAIVEKEIGFRPYGKDIANALGLSPTNYSNMKAQNRIPLREISDYCAKHKISINWVLYEQNSQMLENNTEEIFKIKFLESINGSAGGGALNEEDDEPEYIHIDRKSANRMGINNVKNIEAINVQGDSMQPTLKDGSVVVIDRSKIEVINGGIFVINTVGGGLFVKRISVNPSGGIDMISDNKAYPVQTVSFDEAMVVGRVVGALERV